MIKAIQGFFAASPFVSCTPDDKNNNIWHIHFGFIRLYSFNRSDEFSLRLAVIFLHNLNIPVQRISKIVGINRNTISDWIQILQKKGYNSLFDLRTGPQKVTPEIEAYVIAKYKDLGHCKKYKDIIASGIYEHFNIRIHSNHIPRILTKNGIELSAKRYNRKTNKEIQKPASKYMHNAGLFFVFPFLKDFHVQELFKNVLTLFQGKMFQAMEYVYTLLLFFCANMINVEENIKQYCDKSMGSLIGRIKLPSLRSFRAMIPKLISGLNMNSFQLSLSKKFFKKYEQIKEIYVDGHFMPYFGQWNILKGYNAIRRLAMKGRTLYFLNDKRGRALYYILSNEYKGFREYLLEIAKKMKAKMRKLWEGIILVFDRGGFGKKFLDKLTYTKKY